jgi:S-adenosylmethionine-diacylgycerolhomoserine-N-methlytransferase
MDRMYRRQRHVYDLSRKFYLLGRDGLIDGLKPPAGGTVLEIGCGTGRNLVKIAQAYPLALCHGLDVSAAMLDTAARSVERAGLTPRITLKQGDATGFDPVALFGTAAFDRVVISYALSIIPPWQAVLQQAAALLAPGGQLHIVDFGDQHGLPAPLRAALNRWLAAFDVTPRGDFPAAALALARHSGLSARVDQRYRGYCVEAVLTRPA